MKRYIKLLLILIMPIMLSGCTLKLNSTSMDDIDIYTTIYPIKYLITNLYGDHANIRSIYPSGVDPSDFELSNKKIREYANTDLFVFNSLDRDRDFAVDMINNNKNLKVIDVARGMAFDNDIAELWLNPYNYLMMAQNTKEGLLSYIDDPSLITNNEKNGIDDKYEELKYNLSRLDADMKETISLARYNTIVVDNDLFKFLEKYNLNVISLEETDDLTDTMINEAKKLISDGDVKYIYTTSDETNATCKNLIDTYGIDLIKINAMKTIDGGITNSNESYITVMNDNLELLNKELYK